MSEKRTLREFVDSFHQIVIEFAHFVLLDACIMLSVHGAYNFSRITLLVPTFLLVYSMIVWIVYACLMTYKLDRTENKRSSHTNITAWNIILASAFFIHYTKYVGKVLGGTQWLVIALRRFGACIGNDVIVDDLQSLYDVHLVTIGDHTRISSTCQIQCHTYEQRRLKLRPITIGPACIFRPMSFVLPGATFIGYNRIAPCSLTLPDDQFAANTDWFGSPTKRTIVHHGMEPPKLILAERRSSTGSYNVIIGRFYDDILTLYFGSNSWMGWQSAIDLRRPFRPCDIYIRLFFTTFLCKPNPKHVLIIGLGGGIWPMLIRHFFPLVVVDVVEIDETVIALACDFFGLAEQRANGYLNIDADDGFRYVRETAHRYDIIFIDAFSEEAMPAHMNTREFFVNLRHILNDDGCLATNCNLPTTNTYNRLRRALCSTFESNTLLTHANIVENAKVIISGNWLSMGSIASQELAIRAAKRLETDVHLEFSLSCLIGRAYGCVLDDSNDEQMQL